MSDMVEFLKARLDEDEAATRAAQQRYDSGATIPARLLGLLINPARILAEVAVKRQILEIHAPVALAPKFHPEVRVCGRCGTVGEYEVDWPCDTVLTIAQPYAGHPDFDPAWLIPFAKETP